MLTKLINDIPKLNHLHIIIGSFDGVHRAHKQILCDTIEQAKSNNEASLIFTFEPLPKEYFDSSKFLGRLTPESIKKKKLENIGADYLIIANFESIKHLSEKKFIET
ncbi:MAG: hypothetical protein ACRCTJ_05565, partial [Brevinema sp.]